MLVPLEGYQKEWQQVKQDSLSHSSYRAVIFVACMDVDSFVASHMLGALLKKHLILYKTEPVSGYESLKQGFNRLDSSIRNVFFIGCGSSVDLEELFLLDNDSSESSSPRPKIHVFDRHRPWNLNNLFGSEIVRCYEDGNSEDVAVYEQAYNFLASQDPTAIESTEESTSGESGDESHNEDLGRFGQGNNVINSDTDEDESENIIEHNNDQDDRPTQEDTVQFDESIVRAKKKRKTQKASSVKILEEYYQQGSHIVSTNAVQIYTLLTLIGETSISMLWLAIIGVTSIEQQNPQLYRMLIPSLQDEMQRLNRLESGSSEGTVDRNSLRIFCEADYSLFLLRQWSLYESMVHSSYLSAKLFLWREEGRKKLHKMLARVGITLQDAKESWIHTNPAFKRELKQKLESVSGSYGIEGVTRSGVVRQFGLSGAMSAGDCCESISAFLESGKSGMTYDDESEPDSTNTDGQEIWIRNFWAAWDSVNKYELLKQGCEQAKILQQAVVSTANLIFDKSLPKDLRSFRMVIVQDAPSIDVFFNPLSLQRLASWVAEGCAEIHTSSTPFVLAVLDEPRNMYLVIGMGNLNSRDLQDNDLIMSHNHFGRQFQSTALAINAKVKIDAFESSIIEVQRADLPRFLEALDSRINTNAV